MAQLKNGEEYLKNLYTGNRPEYTVGVNDLSTYPESEIRHKAARANNWQVCKSWIDVDNKQFNYEVLISADETAIKSLTFDDICKIFHWKKLEVVDNGQKIKWYADSEWNDNIPKMMENGKVKAFINSRKEAKKKEAKDKNNADK